MRIARAEAQGLENMSLGLFGATDESLTESDTGVGRGEISVQRQRVLAFGDALCSALGVDVDIVPTHMCPRAWSGTDDKALVSFASADAKAATRIGHKEAYARGHVRKRRSNERIDIIGIGGERAIKKAARSRDIVSGYPLLSQAKP